MPDERSVVFGLAIEMATLKTGLDHSVTLVRGAVGKINTLFEGLANPFGALVTGAGVGALGLLINKSAELGDRLKNMSIELGVGVERLQELQFAARTSGSGVEQLEKGLAKLNKAIGEAAAGNLAAINLFDDL